MCTKLGYSIGDTITYGNLVNSKDYKPGDAFDCDVNGDGKYDSENERFYYVTDLESNPKYGVLVYSSSVKNGVKKNTATEEHIHYDSSGVNNNGPVTAIPDLPTKSQWPNVELFNNRRQIISSEGETTTLDGTLPVFEYTNKPSRLITLQEAKKGCFNNSSVDKKCEYLVEDTSFENPNFYINNWGLLTETPSGTQSQVVCRIDSHSLDIGCIYKSNLNYFLIKPVIEVHKNKIQ